MIRLWFVVGLLALAFWVFSIVDCAVQPATRHRGVSKGLWVVIVIALPVIGGILWLVIGRHRAGGNGFIRDVGPDDDPSFLRRVSRSEQDARIRQLEAELASLDDDRDGTDGGASDRRS